MCRRRLFVSFLMSVWGLTCPALGQRDPHLVGWWTFDEGSGTVAYDYSGEGNDGAFVNNPQWVSGVMGGALRFDGDNDDQVELTKVLPVGSSSSTVAVWIKVPFAGRQGLGASERVGDVLGNYPDSPNSNWELHSAGQMRLWWNGGQINTYGTTDLRDNTWHHVAWVRDKTANAISMYIDGQLEATIATVGTDINFTTTHRIGGDNRGNPPCFHGLMDDLQVYSRVLLQDEIVTIMRGPIDYRMPSSPQPPNEAGDVLRDVVLSWSPGMYAATHDVYLGTSFADVIEASRANPLDVLVSRDQTATTYTPTDLLEYGQTYYWRVDEVNSPPDSTIFSGELWSFTVEPIGYALAAEHITATASSTSSAEEGPENTIGGVGLDANDLHSVDVVEMWLSGDIGAGESAWIQYGFDKVYSLHKMLVWNHNGAAEPLIGLGIREATIEYSLDGDAWMSLGDVHTFARAPGKAGYAVETPVAFKGAACRYVRITAVSNWEDILNQYGLSEVRFLYAPMRARQPEPASGAADVAPQLTLSWRAGRETATHELYLSTDEQAVIDGTAPVVIVSEPSFDTGALDLAQTYYWRVDEVNETAPIGVWEGDVWSFSVLELLIIDDFESYTDYSPDRIFQTWIDGWGFSEDEFFPNGHEGNGTGAQVGGLTPPFAEQTIVHSGRQSMRVTYSNAASPFYSEAERSFAVPQDWTAHGVKTLSLYVRGAIDNDGQLYVKINDAKKLYDGDPADIAKVIWQPWNVDLSAVGGNLANVRQLTIGIEGLDAEGIFYIDDIRLYPKAREFITPVEPDSGNRLGWWTFDEGSGSVARDHSGHGNDATLAVGDLRWVSGKIDGALEFDGVRHQLALTSPLTMGSSSNTVAGWVKVPLAGTENLDAGERVGVILGNYPDSPNTNWEFHDDGQMRLHWNGGEINTFGTTDLRDNTWHHVAWVRDKAADTCYMYIDGRLEATYQSAGADVTFGTAHTIGGDNRETGVPHFHGLLDDLQVYSEALSAVEIAWLAGLRMPMHVPF